MIRMICTFEITCDGPCKRTAIASGRSEEAAYIVAGYERFLVHGCGLTNYTRENWLCPSCAEKERAKRKPRKSVATGRNRGGGRTRGSLAR